MTSSGQQLQSASSQNAFAFTPIFQERVWGGRRLAGFPSKKLPAGRSIGESWECVDRPEAQSLVHAGGFTTSLHQVWTEQRDVFFDPRTADAQRFPVLIKILDATEALSVQVHPSASVENAPWLGEPKNEWWYILEAEPDSVVYAGFRADASREAIEAAVHTGTLESVLHKIPVQKGDSLYVPGGRCHAIGAGCLIAEVQQNSDTTFRMFDWNRTNATGVRRPLHIQESLSVLRWDDPAPCLAPPLADSPFVCDFFSVQLVTLLHASRPANCGGAIFMVVSGSVAAGASVFTPGECFLVPASALALALHPVSGPAALLQINLPLSRPADGVAPVLEL